MHACVRPLERLLPPVLVAATASIALLGAAAAAPPPAVPATALPRPGARPDRAVDLPLGLQDTLELALRAEPSLAVARLEPALAAEKQEAERAAWDLRSTATLQRTDDRQVSTSRFDGRGVRTTRTDRVEAGLVQPLHRGGQVDLKVIDQRTETSSANATINPSYRTAVTVSWKHPLARGQGTDATRRAVNQARLDLEDSRWSLAEEVLSTLARTERAYWELAAARENLEVARLSVEQAELLLDSARHRVKAGVMAGVSIVEAQAGVAERRAALLSAQREVAVAQIELASLAMPPARPDLVLPPLSDVPGRDLPELPAHDALLEQARRSLPAYRRAQLDLARERVELAWVRDGLLPRLDLVTEATTNGLAGSRSDSVDLLGRTDFPTWFVGLSWEVTLGRRAERAAVRRQELLVERATRSLYALESGLETSLTRAATTYRVDLERMNVEQLRVSAAQEKLDAEKDRFTEGLVTADDLLRFVRDLAVARQGEVQARTQASLSALAVWEAAGILAERRGIVLDPLGVNGTPEEGAQP